MRDVSTFYGTRVLFVSEGAEKRGKIVDDFLTN